MQHELAVESEVFFYNKKNNYTASSTYIFLPEVASLPRVVYGVSRVFLIGTKHLLSVDSTFWDCSNASSNVCVHLTLSDTFVQYPLFDG